MERTLSQLVLHHAHALCCCATHLPPMKDVKGDCNRVEKEAKHQKLQQTLRDSPATPLPLVSPLVIAPMDKDLFNDLLRD